MDLRDTLVLWGKGDSVTENTDANGGNDVDLVAGKKILRAKCGVKRKRSGKCEKKKDHNTEGNPKRNTSTNTGIKKKKAKIFGDREKGKLTAS